LDHQGTNSSFRYRHPYETEIQHLQYPKSVYEKAEPIPYLPVDTTSAVFVDTEEGVLEMLEELKTATEIAVDLEHHDARSHVGLVSLMQISTRNKDWIVDTLKPWRQKLEVLNEVFADPNIVKVCQFSFNRSLYDAHNPGISWCIHGYCMAAARFRTLCCRTLRHTLCFKKPRVRWW